MTVWPEGNTFCHSCKTKGLTGGSKHATLDTKEYTTDYTVANTNNSGITLQYIPLRDLTSATLKKYEAQTRVSPEGEPLSVVLPYGPAARKVRDLSRKQFRWEGEASDAGLFGQSSFKQGLETIIITEGEVDAMSAHQMTKLPAVSIKSASTAERDCGRSFDFLNSYQKIYLCMDMDAPGQEAVAKIAPLFNPGKVFHIKLLSAKDANECLMEGMIQEFRDAITAAKLYLPEGIVGSFSEIETILRSEGQAVVGTYPFPTLNGVGRGIRSSEVVLLTAQEGIGKTEVVRSIEHHLLKTTDFNMGIIHLEETDKRAVQGLIGYEMHQPVHFEDCPVSVEDQLLTYKALCQREGRVYLYPRFGSDDPNVILDTVRYLAGACRCKFVFLDHITMIVTGFEGDDERRKLDYLSTRFSMLVKELDFTLFLVSHVNDNGQTRGSRNISKVADISVHLDRDIEHSDSTIRNTTKLLVRKNRFGSTTGPAGRILFDPTTFRLDEKEDIIGEDLGF